MTQPIKQLIKPSASLNLVERAKKWERLTVGLSGRDASRCAWVAEDEARYLKSTMGTPDAPMVGTVHLVFPALFRAVPALAEKPEFAAVHVELEAAFASIFENQNRGCVRYDRPDNDATWRAFTSALAERTHHSILNYPG